MSDEIGPDFLILGILQNLGNKLVGDSSEMITVSVSFYKEATDYVYRLALVPMGLPEHAFIVIWLRTKTGHVPVKSSLGLDPKRQVVILNIPSLTKVAENIFNTNDYKRQATNVKYIAKRDAESKNSYPLQVIGGPHKSIDSETMFEVYITSAYAVVSAKELEKLVEKSTELLSGKYVGGDVNLTIVPKGGFTVRTNTKAIEGLAVYLKAKGVGSIKGFYFDMNRGVAISIPTGFVFTREFTDEALGVNEGLDEHLQYYHDSFCDFANRHGFKPGVLIRKEYAVIYRNESKRESE